MKGFGRLLVLAGAVGAALSVVLPWLQVRGALPRLSVLGAALGPGHRTVNGSDTSAWPVLVAAAALAGLLAVLGRARRVAVVLGALITLAGTGLVYYLQHVVDLRTAGKPALERDLAHLALDTSVQSGPFVLLAAGVLTTLGAMLSHPHHPGQRSKTGRSHDSLPR